MSKHSSIQDSLPGSRAGDWATKMIQEGKEARVKEHQHLLTSISSPLYSAFTKNMDRNRDPNLILFDQTRVTLKPNWKGDISYIHASLVHDGDFIITQNPLQNTLTEFWRCLWQENVSVIVSQSESKPQDTDCAVYYPRQHGKKLKVGGKNPDAVFGKSRFVVKNVTAEPNVTDISEVIELEVTNSGNGKRRICHIRCLNWTQDFPEEDIVLRLAESIWNCQKSMVAIEEKAEKEKHPILILSTFGTKRSGILAGVCVCYKELTETNRVNIPSVVTKIKFDRYGCFTSETQYAYIYSCIIQAAIKRRKLDIRENPKIVTLQNKLRQLRKSPEQ